MISDHYIDYGTLFQVLSTLSLFLILLWRDSREQSQNDEELESTRFSLEMAEDAVQVGIWNFDINNRIVIGTHFHDQLYGVKEKVEFWELNSIINAIHPDDREVFIARTQEALAGTTLSYAMEYRVVWPDSSIHWHSVMVRLKRDEFGHITHHRGITYDSTSVHDVKKEREQLEIREKAAMESLRLKSEFLANMSHEIRTPINGVMGMTNILLDSGLSLEQQEYAHAIKRSGQSLLVVINDILDFSKIEANKLDFEEIPFSLGQTMDDARVSVRYEAEKKNLLYKCEIDPSIPLSIMGDPGRLQQVLTNLLSNAMKFTAEGQVSVRVSKILEEADSVKIRIEVQDTGVGISEEARARLFQPFQQADNSTTRKYGGSGLGLSICRHLVERMNGEMGFESVVGEGSTFWFTASFQKTQPKTEAELAEESLPTVNDNGLSVATIGRRHILIAEDIPVNQIVAIRMIEKLGHVAHVVGNGQEVLNALYQADYDLILMDCHMPEMDGYEATSAIRRSTTLPNPNILILAMTANAMKGDKERCIEVGMNDYISKPIESKSLQRTLNKWLSTVPMIDR
ncbi:MAG: ATP-binding protein [Bdellovibrionota bacterium]